ncbi:MAG TPA: glucose-1-phosphate adenylyltransferase subunit GlgD [Clostridia bacterium]|nr:glucose-1-phosphate adenylyltransferase subunit GlgD [Clostridia bacterium]HZX21144.1 glucose-1-phosphate adenylyltransferase subunit GlgD [Clostridia bacterium]
MLEDCLGVISFEDTGSEFGVLCKNRPVYMLPFAGRYRLVDFTLSNMINHGLLTIAVFTGKHIRSILDHLGDGKPWDLNRKISGLSIFPPLFDDEKRLSGEIYQYYTTENFFINSKAKYVFIANPNILSKVNLSEVFEYFLSTRADITVVYKKQENEGNEYRNADNLIIDRDGKLINIGINLGLESKFNLFMHMYFMKKEVFLQIIRAGMETGEDLHLKQAVLNYKNMYDINSYEYKGYVKYIKGIKSYYEANMDLLDNKTFDELFLKGGTILTRSRDEPSTFYISKPKVKNSLIANGCIIEGEVKNSILFRGVRVERNAVVKDSILMQEAVIKENAVLVNTILDKYVTVEEGSNIIGIKDNPYTVEKNLVV